MQTSSIRGSHSEFNSSFSKATRLFNANKRHSKSPKKADHLREKTVTDQGDLKILLAQKNFEIEKLKSQLVSFQFQNDEINQLKSENSSLVQEIISMKTKKADMTGSSHKEEELNKLRSENSTLLQEIMKLKSHGSTYDYYSYYQDEINKLRQENYELKNHKILTPLHDYNKFELEKISNENSKNIQLLIEAQNKINVLNNRISELEVRVGKEIHTETYNKNLIDPAQMILLLERKVSHLTGELKARETEVSYHLNQTLKMHEADQKINDLLSDNEKNQEKIYSLADQNEKLLKELTFCKEKISEMGLTIITEQEKSASHPRILSSIQYENEAMAIAIADLQKSLHEKESISIRELEIKLDEAYLKINSQKKLIHDYEDEKFHNQTEVQVEKKKTLTLQKMVEDYEHKISYLDNQLSLSHESLENYSIKSNLLIEETNGLNAKLYEMEHTNHRLQTENDKLTKINSQLDLETQDLKEKISVWIQKFEYIEGDLDFKKELEMKLTSLAKQNIALREKHKHHEADIHEMDNLIKRCHQLEEANLVLAQKIKELELNYVHEKSEKKKIDHEIHETNLSKKSLVDHFEKTRVEYKKRISELESHIHHLQNELDQHLRYKSELHHCTLLISEKERIIKELEFKLSTLSQQHITMKETLALNIQFEEEVHRCKSLINNLEIKIDGLMQENLKLLNIIEEKDVKLKSAITDHHYDTDSLEKKVEQILILNDDYKNQIDSKSLEIKLWKEKYDEEIKINSNLRIEVNKTDKLFKEKCNEFENLKISMHESTLRANNHKGFLLEEKSAYENVRQERDRLITILKQKTEEIMELRKLTSNTKINKEFENDQQNKKVIDLQMQINILEKDKIKITKSKDEISIKYAILAFELDRLTHVLKK